MKHRHMKYEIHNEIFKSPTTPMKLMQNVECTLYMKERGGCKSTMRKFTILINYYLAQEMFLTR